MQLLIGNLQTTKSPKLSRDAEDEHSFSRTYPNDPGMQRFLQGDRSKVKIGDMLTNRKWWGDDHCGRFFYIYDMGFEQEHALEVKGRAPKMKHFDVLGGNGHPKAEDTVAEQWQELKDAFDKPPAQRTAEEREQISWYKDGCANGDRAGLKGDRKNKWNKNGVKAQLKMLGQW